MPLNRALTSLWLRVRVGLGGLLGARRWVLDCLDDALALNGDDAYAWATLAHQRADHGDWSGAGAALERCVALQPNDASHWFNLGYVHERGSSLHGAERAFRRAAELDPRLDRAWYGLGLALIAQDRLAEAVEALQVNTRLQPMSPHGWYQLARVQVDLGAEQEARGIILRLRGFEPKVAAQLARETGLCL